MKTTRIFLLAAAALLAACAKQTVDTPPVPDEMVFNPRVSTKVTGSSFDPGDKIGVFVTQYDGETPSVLQIGGNYINNASVEFNGTNWSATPKIFWSEGKFDVFAFYPRGSVSSVSEYPFMVQEDQSVTGTEEGTDPIEMSDLLWATNKGISQCETVPLIFSHKMSKVTLNLVKGEDYEGELPEEAEVFLYNTVRSALFDIATGDVLKDPKAATGTIKARKTGTGTYTAIVVPQMLTNRVPLFEIVCKDVSYLLETRFQFKSGVNHTVNITLTDNPEKVRIDIGGEIIGW